MKPPSIYIQWSLFPTSCWPLHECLGHKKMELAFTLETHFPLGKVGRSTQSLKWVLAKLCQETQENWIKLLLMALLPMFSSVQFSHSLVSDSLDPMNRSMPGPPVHHQLLEFTQTHAHRVGDAIQPSHPLFSPSPPTPNSSQHQGLFQ